MRAFESRRIAWLAIAGVVAIVGAGCGDGDDDTTDTTEAAEGADTTEAVVEDTADTATEATEDTATEDTEPPAETTEATETGGEAIEGGELVVGAEQWPECINPITSCANSSWMHYSTAEHVLPRAMELDPGGNYVPSPLLAGEPELTGEGTGNGDGPFTVTFNINPDAVWDDGTPITSADFEFTWHAYLDTVGTLTTVGYDQIESMDVSDPATAVVTFIAPYAPWWDMFGGGSQYVFKADAFGGNTDTADAMATEYGFSGGPWILDSFSETEAILVRNEAYWDPERIPVLDSVIMVPLADQETEINALLAGEVAAIYPQPAPGIADQLTADGVESTFAAGTTYEALWFTHASLMPDVVNAMADPLVREALLFAVDRQAILETVIHPNFPNTELLNCGAWVPTVGGWCDNTDFADVAYDPARVDELLTEAGWAKGDDGFYAKDGQRLTITWQTVAGNLRRENIQALLIPAMAELGIELIADNSDADTLFQTRLPQLQTELALYAQVASPDPSITTIAACDNIPTEENSFSGQNNTAWCNEEASALMAESDATLDVAAREELIHQVGDAIRADAAWLPMYQLPLITAWNTGMVTGPVDLYQASPYSAFINLYDWQLVG